MDEIQKEASYKIIAFIGPRLSQEYKGVIYAKWLRTLRYGNDYFKLIDAKDYFENYGRYLDFILQKPSTIVRLAVLSDDTDVVLGFSVSEGYTLHYCYVQRDVRKNGIGMSLMNFGVKQITHVTKIGLEVWNKKFPKAKFNPF